MSDRRCAPDEANNASDQTGETEGEMLPNGGVISLEEIFECLTKPRRRFILYYLQENEIVGIEELAKQIAAWEAGIPPEEVFTDHQERVMVELIHNHLPKLANTQIIEYDRRSSTVRYTNPPVLLDKILELLSRLEGNPRA